MIVKFTLKAIMLVSFSLSILVINAQDLFNMKDLSTVKVDQLSETDLAKIQSQIAGSGMSMEQVEQMALSKGMSVTEFAKLKTKLESLGKIPPTSGKLKSIPVTTGGKQNNSSDTLTKEKYNTDKPRSLINPMIFGSELYTSVSPSFEPNLKLATPTNYVIGPEDGLLVSVYGVQEYNGELVVSDEGNINIPNVGQIRVAGLTIEAATEKLKGVMGSKVYTYLKTGGSKLTVTLNKIRSIKVTIIGAYLPGNYTLSSLATVFNALYLAGGPSEFGSFREIELLRNNKIIKVIDLYRMLLKGDQSDNIGLKDNDVIRIPSYKKRITINGQIKRPGIFEVLPGEKFSNMIDYASGFTDTAYTSSVKVYQNNDRERKIKDLNKTDFPVYEPQSGDIFVVSRILNRFQNRVKISGSVFRPDTYEVSDRLTVKDLIERADGLKEDAYMGRAQIIRLEDDLTRSILSFDVRKALSGDQLNNILLKREDEVFISSIHELKDSLRVTIQGEIRRPGQYDFVEKLTLKDIILQAGGFTDAAHKNIEIARLIKRDSIALTDNRASSIINAQIDGDLGLTAGAIQIMPFDVITVRKKAGYDLPESIIVSGQVQYPGPYAISNISERVSDVLKRAGGFTPDAYPDGAYLKRRITEEEKRKKETAKSIQRGIGARDTSTLIRLEEQIQDEFQKVPLNLTEILRLPGSTEDLVLKPNDELIIPKFDGQIKITGAVLLETQVPFRMNSSFKDYISDAGGYNGSAWKSRAYVVYANGRAANSKRFLFFRSYPKILPGSEIVVPKKMEKKGLSAGEIVGLSSGIASLAGVVIALLNLSR